MNIDIRQINKDDYEVIDDVIFKAFEDAEHSDKDEHNLVKRLRKSKNYIPKLELVAVTSNKIVGHIMLTRLLIEDGNNKHETLALAPLSVLPEFHKKGIGKALIVEALKLSENLGYKSIFVLGSEKYYPKFGFKESLSFGLKAPFEVPSENFMAIELESSSLKGISGNIVYAKEFFEG